MEFDYCPTCGGAGMGCPDCEHGLVERRPGLWIALVERRPDTVIVTRHAGLVAWLAEQGITGRVIAQATAADVRGKIVFGALPFHLAALAVEVVAVDLPGLTPAQRGQDRTPAEMVAAGATLTRYRVTQL